MTKILIVDDESMARLRIRKLAERRADVTAIAEAVDGVDALAKITEFQPDIIFLDIEMPEMTGFEVLENLETIPFAIVFQTAYHQFAIKAFEVNAVDYLLKPFSDQRWNESLERAQKLVSARQAQEVPAQHDAAQRDAAQHDAAQHDAAQRDAAQHDAAQHDADKGQRTLAPHGVQATQMHALKEHLHKHGMFLNRIFVRCGNRQHILKTGEITHFTSEDHITFVHTSDRSFAYDLSLTPLEQKLNPEHFFRIHRSAIVNLDFVKTLTSGNDSMVVLRNNVELAVSREKKRRLREILQVDAK